MIKKKEVLEKQVIVAGQQVSLFSFDGTTWTTKKEELENIDLRYEKQRIMFCEKIGKRLPVETNNECN